MPLKIIDFATDSSGTANEDRAGAAGSLAWIIDGATGVAERRILPGPSDAAWLASAYHKHLERLGGQPYASLPALVETVIAAVIADFEREALHPVEHAYETPSAAGLLVENRDGGLNMITLGDCCLFVESEPGAPVSLYGPAEHHIGDPGIAAAIQKFRAEDPTLTLAQITDLLRPRQQATRAKMNVAYDVLSLDASPLTRIGVERIEIGSQARLLLATDGFTRPWDIFGLYSMDGLFTASLERGLGAIIKELRDRERSDPEGFEAPRLKTHDDATALLVEVTPA